MKRLIHLIKIVDAIIFSLEKAKEVLKTDKLLEKELVENILKMIDRLPYKLKIKLIKTLQVGSADITAKNLWVLYERYRASNESNLKMAVVESMKSVGAICVPYIISDETPDSFLNEALGVIGDPRAVEFLIQQVQKIGHKKKKSEKARVAISKIGEPAVPILIEKLKKDKVGDIAAICKICEGMPPLVIPGIVSVLVDPDTSEVNKMNLLNTLAKLAGRNNSLDKALSDNTSLGDEIFQLLVQYSKNDLDEGQMTMISTLVKHVIPYVDSMSDVINYYGRVTSTLIRSSTVEGMARSSKDEGISFLIGLLSSEDQEQAKKSLSELSATAETGFLREYIKRNPVRGEELVARAGLQIQVDVNAAKILGFIGSEESLSMLIGEFDRRNHQGIEIEDNFFKVLVAASPINLTSPSIERKNRIAEYFQQISNGTELIFKIENYLSKKPDADYSEILTHIRDDIDALNAKARIMFRLGIVRYIREKEKISKLKEAFRQCGIDVPKHKRASIDLTEDMITGNEQLERLINIICHGVTPKRIKIYFLI